MDPRKRLLLGVVLALLSCCCLPWGGEAIENKCGACVAIQTELMDILLQERPRMPLDMRNRLNSQGKREGKVIDYKDSELRIIQILEGLCERVKKYSLKNIAGTKRPLWLHGQKHVNDHMRMVAEEQGKELKRWCDRMLEEYEDDMTEMIRSEVKRAYAEVPIILCRNITGHCKDESTYMAEVKKIAEHLPRPDAGANSSGGPTIEVKSQEAPEDGPDSKDDEAKIEL